MSNEHRLPRTAIPSRYDIRLAPDLEAFTFEGRVKIELDVPTTTDRLVLNSVDLTIQEATIIAEDGGRYTASVTYDATAQRIALRFDRPIASGAYSLRIRFAGDLTDGLRGFYRSTFTDAEGNERAIALTQFESTDARRAFPCWDEPEYKAVFGVKLDIDPALAAFSNGPEIRRRHLEDGKVRITFGDTMKMSTYLVAFVVGPLEATDPIDVDGVPVRIAHPIGRGHLTAWAEETGEWFLRWLAGYYGIPYPGDKVDHVAVPDFAFGAMENLGCITYRETALLLDPATSGQYQKRRIADVVAHELAHMWFGDLVTMLWWDGIWLNEAFASFMEMKAVEAKHPEWDRWLAFAADRGAERFDALIVDALAASRPVEFEVRSPAEADEMFDALTYGKGAAVLRMIEQFIGEEQFRAGVGQYLRTHAYGNTVTSDLWAALDAASEWPVGEIMDTWILQPGYPVVEVRRTPTGFKLSQRRFLLIPDETDQTLFRVPIQVRYALDGEVHETKVLLTEDETTIDVGAVDWVVANGGGHGFYRVAYESDLLDALVAVAAELRPLERFTLLDDVGWLAVSGDMALADWFRLAETYTNEGSQQVWQMLFAHLGDIDQLVPDADRAAFSARVGALLGEVAGRLGTTPDDGDDELDRLLRGQVLTVLGTIADDPDTVAFANEALEGILADFGSMDPDVMTAVLGIAGSHADPALTERLVVAHRDAPTAQIAQQLLASAARTRSDEAARRLVDACLDGPVRKQDTAWVLARLLKSRHARRAGWMRIRERFDEILAEMPTMTQRHLAEGFASITEPDLGREVQAFLAETPLPSAAKAVAQSLERMEANVAFAAREVPRLSETLTGESR